MIYFVVPAYNEEKNIAKLMAETHAFCAAHQLHYNLIVVDDGSVDKTAEIVESFKERLPCTLIRYQPNRGVAEAFRAGLRAALSLAKDSDVIVTKEADRTSDLGIFFALMGKINSGCDVALASCYSKGGRVEGTTWNRVLLSRCANFLIYTAFHIKGVHTYSSFYRVYRPAALRRVLEKYGDFFDEKGFACVIELLVRLSRCGVKIQEVPMVLKCDLRQDKSKMKVLSTIAGYFRVIVRNRVLG